MIWGHFLERRLFDDFRIGKKLAKFLECCSGWRQKVIPAGDLGKGRRAGRGARQLRYRQITARNWQHPGMGFARSCPETVDGESECAERREHRQPRF